MNQFQSFFQNKFTRLLTFLLFFGVLLTQVIQSQNEEKVPAKEEKVFHSSKSISPPRKSKKPKPQEEKENKSSKVDTNQQKESKNLVQEQQEKKIPQDDLKKFPIHPSSKAPDFK